MLTTKGNIWHYHPDDTVCITINKVIGKNGLIMGKGIALQAKELYPELPKQWASMVSKILDYNVTFYDKEHNLIATQTKEHWRNPSKLEIIKKSLFYLVKIAEFYGMPRIYLPPLGCGNGGLDWETQVKPLMASKLDNRFIVINN